MTLEEVKQAVDDGKPVCWANPGYKVIKDKIGCYLIHCTKNDHYVGLTKAYAGKCFVQVVQP